MTLINIIMSSRKSSSGGLLYATFMFCMTRALRMEMGWVLNVVWVGPKPEVSNCVAVSPRCTSPVMLSGGQIARF